MFRFVLGLLLIMQAAVSYCSKEPSLNGGWTCKQIIEPPAPSYAQKIHIDTCGPDVDRSKHPECIKREIEGCPTGAMFRFSINDDGVTGRASVAFGRYEGDAPYAARVTLDPKSTPSRLILGFRNEMLNGIYKLDGKHLTVKFPVWPPNQPAPKEFGLEPGFRQIELDWRDDAQPSY
jgi:hypothetical protein